MRFSFLVVGGQGQVVTRPKARVWLARGAGSEAVPRDDRDLGADRDRGLGRGGRRVRSSSPGSRFRRPGKYWVLAEPIGGRRIQALGNVVVAEAEQGAEHRRPGHRLRRRPRLPARAATSMRSRPRSRPIASCSVCRSPRRSGRRRRSSSRSRRRSSAPRGPAGRSSTWWEPCERRSRRPKIRFIHVEIFEDNDPTKGTNRWVNEWKLPSEPFTFLVGADGLVKERFEGTFSVRELTAAVERELRR